MNLSPHFTLAEMVASPTARRMGFTEQFEPPPHIIAALKELCLKILEPLRKEVGPIVVSSGYRCARLNKKVKGAKNSQHLVGEAADIKCVNYKNKAIFLAAQKLKLPYDQLIWEYGTRQEPDWIHVSLGPRNRKQILYIGV